MIFLGFVWLILLIVEFVWGLSKELEYISLVIWGIFIVDFLLKLVLAPSKRDFFRRNWLTAVSLVIPALRVLRILRILRVMRGIRLVKVLASMNRSMKSLRATMSRRGVAYVLMISLLVIFGGAAGMYGIEKGNQGFENYGMALWWTAMRVITAGSDFWPATNEGRMLAFLIALFGYAIFGYITATLASFFIGRDAEEKDTQVVGKSDITELKNMIASLQQKIENR